MIVRRIDVDGDWTFGAGKNNYLKDQAAVAQSITTRLRSFLGDCFFDMLAGVDWWNLLGSKDLLRITLSQKMVILNTQDVTGIIEISSEIDHTTRRLTTQYSVSSTYSEDEPITGTVGIP